MKTKVALTNYIQEIYWLIKAVLLKKKLNEYIENRKFSIAEEELKHGWFNRFIGWWKRKCPFFLGGEKSDDDGDTKTYSTLDKFRISLFTNGTYENYVLKSIIGFLSGVILTYFFFIFFILQLNLPLGSATTLCSLFGIILTLGLAFSYNVRCIVFMLMPQFFSTRGRQALVAYAFILVLTGPAKNTLHNMRVLSETMACGQGKLKDAVKNLLDLIKKPFFAIKESMKQVMEKIKVVIEKIKGIIKTIKQIVSLLIGVIKSAYEWLNSIVSLCNKTTGTPFQKCQDAFRITYDSCVDNVPSLFESFCQVTDLVQGVCYIVKPIDYVCELFEFVSDEMVAYIKKKLREFSAQVKNIFYVCVKFSHNYDFHAEQSKSVKEITAGIMLEIRQRSDNVVYFFDWMGVVFSFFFLYMLFQVLNYKRKYMSNDWFDNHFITENLIHLDIERTRRGMETILPLNVHERKKYVRASSISLIENEQRSLARSAIFLCLSSVKLSIHMLADYSLWWVLDMIRFHAQFQTNMDTPANVKVLVDGKGMLADLYSTILNTFQPSGIKMDVDTTPCLPDPMPPDIPRYKQIASLIALAWLLSFLEPYGLRVRNVAMGYYYPARARVRAVWLYNHILRKRGSFLKYARRQLRRMFLKDGEGVEKISLMDRLRATCPFLHQICKGKELQACLLCGGVGSTELQLVKCPRPDCVGIYCVPCYAQLQNLCTICRLPIEYGDLSDISEEKDSSDDNVTIETLKEEKKIPKDANESENESDVTEALIGDTDESELSYGYQYKEHRDINKDKAKLSYGFKDSEKQKQLPRATLDDYAFPIEQRPEETEQRMTLAQRKRSGMWSFVHDPGRHLQSDVQKDVRNNISIENISDSPESDLQKFKNKEELPINLPKNNVDKRYHKDSNVRKPLLVSESEKSSEDNESVKFSLNEVYKSKNKNKARMFGNLKNRLLIKKKKENSFSKDESSDIKLSTVRKSSKMVKNWIKTGSYHNPEDTEEDEVQASNVTPSNDSELKVKTGFKNFFQQIFTRKKQENDVENISLQKRVNNTGKFKKLGKFKFKKKKKSNAGGFWGFWNRKKAKTYQTQNSEISDDSFTHEEMKSHKTEDNPNLTRTIHQFSVMRIEDEARISTNRLRTPAKIVHERFRVDENLSN